MTGIFVAEGKSAVGWEALFTSSKLLLSYNDNANIRAMGALETIADVPGSSLSRMYSARYLETDSELHTCESRFSAWGHAYCCILF